MTAPSGRPPRVIVVAGSDPLGYSGLQADLRHLSAIGLDPVGVPSCLTEQGRDGGVVLRDVPLEHIYRSVELLLSESPTAVVKLGLLHRADVVDALGSALRSTSVRVVLDPVLESSSGEALVTDGMVEALRGLGDAVTLITPNIPELLALTAGTFGDDENDFASRCFELLELGMDAVLLKGGHRDVGADVTEDILFTASGEERFLGPRIHGANPRGTGCALSSLIAGGLAVGWSLSDAVRHGTQGVRRAIARSVEWSDRRLLLDEATRVWPR